MQIPNDGYGNSVMGEEPGATSATFGAGDKGDQEIFISQLLRFLEFGTRGQTCIARASRGVEQLVSSAGS